MGEKKKHTGSLKVKLIAYIVTVVLTVAFMIQALYQIQTRGQEENQKNMSFVALLDEVIKELAATPSKEELLATIVGCLISPVSALVSVLEQIAEKKEAA